MAKEQVHTVTDLPSSTSRKRLLVWGGTAVAGAAALALIAATRAKKTSEDTDEA